MLAVSQTRRRPVYSVRIRRVVLGQPRWFGGEYTQLEHGYTACTSSPPLEYYDNGLDNAKNASDRDEFQSEAHKLVIVQHIASAEK